jgi:uncharacterized membrane protein
MCGLDLDRTTAAQLAAVTAAATQTAAQAAAVETQQQQHNGRRQQHNNSSTAGSGTQQHETAIVQRQQQQWRSKHIKDNKVFQTNERWTVMFQRQDVVENFADIYQSSPVWPSVSPELKSHHLRRDLRCHQRQV